MEAHIAEHLAFEYRKQLEEQLGAPLPKPDEVLPEDTEVELSRLVARAAQQLLQKDTAEAEEDPILQMQKQELQIKQMEAQAKAQKMQADTALEQAKLELEKLNMDSQERIAGAKIGAEAVNQQKELDAKEFIEGTKLGAQAVAAKTRQKPQQ
jgi:hypothetical protein